MKDMSMLTLYFLGMLKQVNLCQKLFMLCTKIVPKVRNNFCTQHVLPRVELGIFMYRGILPYANFITANFITAVFQNYY